MRLAVLIPAYNPGDDLRRTLDSLALDATPFDIVVVDDGSAEPLDVPSAVGGHPSFLIRLPENRGIAHALNIGLRWVLERGYDYLARLDAGDLNEPVRLARQTSYLDRHAEVALVGAWTRHLDEEMRPLYITRYPTTWEAIRRRFHYRSAFSHGACMLRTSVLRKVGGYAEDCPLGEDYELFWRVAAECPCANIPEVLVTRVERPTSLTHANRRAMARIRLVLQWRHFTWRQLDCWLGVARSVGLLLVPPRLALTLKRVVGSVG